MSGPRIFQRRSGAACYLTVSAPTGQPLLPAAELAFAELATIRTSGVEPFVEQVYGPVDQRDAILDRRVEVLRAAGVDPDTACAFTEGRSEAPACPVSVQVWGVIEPGERGIEIKNVESPGARTGRLLTSPGASILWLPGITGASETGELAAEGIRQAEQMFVNAEAALMGLDFSYLDVVRTWIYSRHLLAWYDGLNRIQTAFNRDCGISGTLGRHPFPASTVVQGHRGAEECLMDVLAVRMNDGRALPEPLLASHRQGPAFAYGASLSRAMALHCDGQQTVLVSGTASIGPKGETLYAGDPEAQVIQVLLGVAALLELRGGTLADLCAGTLYVKDQRAERAFAETVRSLGMDDLPFVTVYADLFRPGLEVELEAVAVIREPARAAPGSAK